MTKFSVYELVKDLLKNNDHGTYSVEDISTIYISKEKWNGEELVPEYKYCLHMTEMNSAGIQKRISKERLKNTFISYKNTQKEDFKIVIATDDCMHLFHEPNKYTAINVEFFMELIDSAIFEDGDYPEVYDLTEIKIEYRDKIETPWCYEDLMNFGFKSITPEYIKTEDFDKIHLRITMEYEENEYKLDKKRKLWVKI